jgi:hypothetical protein
MKNILTAVLILLSLPVLCQERTTPNRTTVGFELDALPYITGGYYFSVWVGHNHMRYRSVVTKATTPEFLLKEGFTNNDIHAYTLIADYFFKTGFKGWWIGSGFEYWKGQIQADTKLSNAKYSNAVFTVGGGYVWKFYKNFYLNPWTGCHLRIAGDTEVMVDGEKFVPPFFTPELSIKIGWHF